MHTQRGNKQTRSKIANSQQVSRIMTMQNRILVCAIKKHVLPVEGQEASCQKIRSRTTFVKEKQRVIDVIHVSVMMEKESNTGNTACEGDVEDI